MSAFERLSRLPYPRTARGKGLLAAVVAVVVAGLVAYLLVGRGSGDAPAAAPQQVQGPVVLVPGYGGGTDALDDLARRLRTAGHTTQVMHLIGDGTGDLGVQAALLRTTVDALLAKGAPSVDVVGYSAGGIVTRLWAAELGGAAHARRIVLLGSPNHGTQLAALGALLGPSVCTVACKQLEPGSDLLTRLNDDGVPSGPQWVSIWTTQDQIVTPPDTAKLDGATNVTVQSVSPSSQVDHGNLPRDPTVQGLVIRALAVAPFPAPSS